MCDQVSTNTFDRNPPYFLGVLIFFILCIFISHLLHTPCRSVSLSVCISKCTRCKRQTYHDQKGHLEAHGFHTSARGCTFCSEIAQVLPSTAVPIKIKSHPSKQQYGGKRVEGFNLKLSHKSKFCDLFRYCFN